MITVVEAVSNGLTSVAAFALAGLTLKRYWYFGLALICLAFWSLTNAYGVWLERPGPNSFLFAIELVANGLMLAFVEKHYRRIQVGHKSQRLVVLIATSSLVGLALLAVGHFLLPNLRPAAVQWVIVVMMFQHLAGLVLTEQLLRNQQHFGLWHFKFLAIALVLYFGFNFVFYSLAVLLQDFYLLLWLTKPIVALITLPFFWVAINRKFDEAIQLYAARKIVFHTTMLAVAGLFLILTAAAGQYIRSFGGTVGDFFQVLLVLLVIVAGLTLLASGRVRDVLARLVSRHIFTSKYDYGELWQSFNSTLFDTDSRLDANTRVLQAIVELMSSTGGVLWYFNEFGKAVPKANYTPNEQVPTFDRGEKFFEKWLKNPRVSELSYQKDLPEFLRQPECWLLVPLMSDGNAHGFVLLFKPRLSTQLDTEDRQLLKLVGQQAAHFLNHHLATQALADARQFETWHQISAFVVHDLKTLNAQFDLLVKNSEKHRENPAFIDDVLVTLGHANKKMASLLEKVRQPTLTKESKPFAIQKVLSLVEDQVRLAKPKPSFSGSSQLTMLGQISSLQTCLVNLVNNAIEACDSEGQVAIEVSDGKDFCAIRIIDDGVGMSEEFLNHQLFRPFQTNKGVKGMGLGLYQCRTILEELGGSIEVQSELHVGTTVELHLPAYKDGIDESIAGR